MTSQQVRTFVFSIIEAKWFEAVITFVIVASSVMLAMESPWKPDSGLASVTKYADKVFLLIFTFVGRHVLRKITEALIKPFGMAILLGGNLGNGQNGTF